MELIAKQLESIKFTEEELEDSIQCGIGYLFKAQPESESDLVLDLYKKGFLRVLVATMDLAWALSDLKAQVVII